MKNTNSLSAPINSSGEQVCVLDGWGILLNSYRRDNIAAEDRV